MDPNTAELTPLELPRDERVAAYLQPKLRKMMYLAEKPLLSNRACKRVDIIVLKWKLPDIETRCMEALIRNTDWPHQVTWYDNRNQSANFAKIWNRLVLQSCCDYIVIMDSDAFVSKGWLTRMMECFEPDFEARRDQHSSVMVKAAPVGVVGPVTNMGGASNVQGGAEHKDKRPFIIENEQPSGYFFLFRKCLMQDIGYFDERFYLHGQDSEWMDRVKATGWNSLIHPGVFVEHLTSASIDYANDAGMLNKRDDVNYTRTVYNIINKEKLGGIYDPVRY